MFVDIRDFTCSPRPTLPRTRLPAPTHCSRLPCPPLSAPVDTSIISSWAMVRWSSSAHRTTFADHADAALRAAVLIHRRVAERFGGELRIGIGINTGKLSFLEP